MKKKPTFGARVRARRLALKLTQEQAAAMAGIPQSHWSAIERRRENVTLATAAAVAWALECTIDNLMKGS
ncbi:MAG TPA: helix-turn-helix transcriptional regulator [Hyphomicrobiaceae bacterium]|nr:helix-turn-helix transcriptional regulator [Hyphomicrobiaceae bacterium]